MTDTDVIIAGAGPVGLTRAASCATPSARSLPAGRQPHVRPDPGAARRERGRQPESGYYAVMGIGLAAALGVITVTLPLLRRMTSPGNVRFE